MSAMNGAGINTFNVGSGRTVVLQEKRKGLGLVRPFRLMEEQADILSLIIPPAQEEDCMDFIIEQGELTLPGRGAVYSEEVALFEPPDLFRKNSLSLCPARSVRKQSHLTGICCVVQRGQANQLARVALDTGISVPAVTFGVGTGVRDKLGLLRIAVPAEKEIIHLAMSNHDADTMMRMMISAGSLDQPGKGFIFTFPISKGLIDTKITHGITRHVASIEQIIATLDELKGDTIWRRRGSLKMITPNESYLLGDLSDMTLTCNEGRAQDLVKEAMRAGAGGATIGRVRHHGPADRGARPVSAAREICNMAVQKAKVNGILEALLGAGAFNEETCGRILVRPVPKAFTYSAPK